MGLRNNAAELRIDDVISQDNITELIRTEGNANNKIINERG